jgi:transposase
MDRQPLRDWVIRYNEAGIPGLSARPHGGGAQSKLSEAEKAQVACWVRQGPEIVEDGVVRWRLRDLRDRILARFFVVMDERSVGRILKSLKFSHISVRPRHPQADAAARGKPIELWWQDEAQIGQKGSLSRIWAELGTPPRAPHDQRYSCAYLFGAVCRARRWCRSGAAAG